MPSWTLTMTVLACLCAANLAGCPRCGPPARAAWTTFAAEHPGATPGQLVERAIAADRADVVLGLARNTDLDVNAVGDPARHESTTPLMTALRGCKPALVPLIAGLPGFDLSRSLAPHDRFGWAATCPAAVSAFLALPGVDVNDADAGGLTLLHAAVRGGDRGALAAVLARSGVIADPADQSGVTPLQLAAVAGDASAVEALLAHPLDVNRRLAGDDRTALITAAEEGHDAVVALLLAHPGVDVATSDRFGNTALHVAADRGHDAVVAALLAAPGRALNAEDQLGRTPLARAAFAGHAAVVARLLAAPDVQVNRVDQDRHTPLWWAAAAGKLDVVQRLVDDPRVKLAIRSVPTGETPHAAATSGKYTAIATLLADRISRLPAGDPRGADTLDPDDDYVARPIPPRPPRTIPPGIKPKRPR